MIPAVLGIGSVWTAPPAAEIITFAVAVIITRKTKLPFSKKLVHHCINLKEAYHWQWVLQFCVIKIQTHL